MPQKTISAASLRSLMQGRWDTLYAELDGKAIPEAAFASNVLEYSGNTFKVEKAGVVAYEGTFLINTSTHPVEVVYIYSKSLFPLFLGGPRPGILQLEGDTLKTCMGALGCSAPTEFNTYLDSDSVLTIHRKSDKPKSVSQAAVSSGARPVAGLLSDSGDVAMW